MSKFVVYEKVAEAVYSVYPKSTMSDSAQTVVNLGSGLIAGFAAAIVSQPADTMLSKINKVNIPDNPMARRTMLTCLLSDPWCSRRVHHFPSRQDRQGARP